MNTYLLRSFPLRHMLVIRILSLLRQTLLPTILPSPYRILSTKSWYNFLGTLQIWADRLVPTPRYANKLIPGVGLALAFYDMLTCGEGKIKWGDGLVWHKST